MSDQGSTMSSVKLGISVAWPAFWTGVPIKLVIALLFLSMGVHPWEGAGLVFLLLLSIPIDIWALGLTARTVFLERLRVEPPEGIGLTLWWQITLMSVVCLPLFYFIQSGTVAAAKAVTHKVMTLFEAVPIAEKITLELVLWGSVATVMLIALTLGWLALVGRITSRQAAAGRASRQSYQALIRQWDLLRVPADQPLLLGVFTGVGVLVIVLFWGFLPAKTPHPHEDYEMPTEVVKKIKPEKALNKAEEILLQAEVAVKTLEKKSGKSARGGKSKKAGK